MKYYTVLLLLPVNTALALLFTAPECLAVYSRPCSLSTAWSTLAIGETVNLEVRTAAGWFGFDPGVAQGANSGSFRFRWISPGNSIPGTDSLPVVWAPAPEVVYAMTQTDTPVYRDRDTTSTPIAVIPANSAAAILATEESWIRVNLYNSPDSLKIKGWILSEAISVN